MAAPAEWDGPSGPWCASDGRFHRVTESDDQCLLCTLGLGSLHSLAGIEISDFFLDAAGGRYVLTVFERLTHAQLPLYLGLMQHLARKGLPVPPPMAPAAPRCSH